jgi:hypothetical protein
VTVSDGMQPSRDTVRLGRLVVADPRAVWPNEAQHFTPWLLQNGSALGEALGIELELTAAEHAVGGYSLDLIGRDLTNAVVLIIENQLAGSDHGHLGQLLTYAAGTNASTIVWITTSFRDEHRQALDWLNEHTDEHTHFFGVEMQVVTIGDSLPAPLFRLVAVPNDWQKAVHASTSGQLAGRTLSYKEFWTKYVQRLHSRHPEWSRGVPPGGNEFWMAAPMLRGCGFKCAFNGSGRLRHELYIDRATAEECRQLFSALQSQQEAIESAYGRDLRWDDDPRRKACRIIDERDGDVSIEAEHERYIEFLIDAGSRFRSALAVFPSAWEATGGGPGNSNDG